MVTSGLWGILFLVGLVAVLAAAYVKQLGVYKKIMQLVASGVMVLTLFMSPAAALSGGAEAGGDSSSVDIDISYGIGFWIMLICSLALAGLAVISFFQLKGNVVFDTINADNDTAAAPMNTPDFGAAAQKIGDFTKNIAGNFTKRTENGNNTVAQQPAPMAGQPMNPVQQGAPAAGQPAPMVGQPMNPVRQGAPVAGQPAPMVRQPMNPVQQGTPVAGQPAPANADYYMEQLEKLFTMKEKGILTEEEFAQKKKEYLKKM
ncbi:MAG: SHOCT domain-containing protein [Clostridia bacterium]|nr:SHOCT domain-containing protein [Clostridia bacterium]